MTGSGLLQFLLYLQVFIMGGFVALAIRHYLVHMRPGAKAEETPLQQQTPQQQAVELPGEMKQRLLQASQQQFEAAVKNAAAQLSQELDATNGQVNDLVMRLATEVVSGELTRYKEELAQLHQQTQTDLSGIRTEVSKHQEELKAKAAQDIEAEKQKLLKQIDAKLADAVGSFLVEALGHNVDLGSQSTYLVSLLEEHKADFAKEIQDDPVHP